MNARSHEIIHGIRKKFKKFIQNTIRKKSKTSSLNSVLWDTNLSKCTKRTYIAAVAGVILSGGSNFDLNRRWIFVKDEDFWNVCIHENEF